MYLKVDVKLIWVWVSCNKWISDTWSLFNINIFPQKEDLVCHHFHYKSIVKGSCSGQYEQEEGLWKKHVCQCSFGLLTVCFQTHLKVHMNEHVCDHSWSSCSSLHWIVFVFYWSCRRLKVLFTPSCPSCKSPNICAHIEHFIWLYLCWQLNCTNTAQLTS